MLHVLLLLLVPILLEARELIEGGNQVTGYDYMGSVQRRAVHICGSTLIRNQYIVTSAACTFLHGGLASGSVTFLQYVDPKTRQFTTIDVHPDYDPETGMNDVAILGLSSKLGKFPPIDEAKSPRDDSLMQVGDSVFFLGYGNDNGSPLRRADTTIVDVSECNTEFDATYPDDGSYICTKGSATACEGDLGDPLLSSDGSVQLGVLSKYSGCGEDEGYQLFVNLAAFEDFILGTIGTTAPTTTFPTQTPSMSPTLKPTGAPLDPTAFPTSSPPTLFPTKSLPTEFPTGAPVEPTAFPTQPVPTAFPTHGPSMSPSTMPTGAPVDPTPFPTTPSPTEFPTKFPTAEPTMMPSDAPISPTQSPSNAPTDGPTPPTLPPTEIPSVSPTMGPTQNPTNRPTMGPSVQPTSGPTNKPSKMPSKMPSMSPTYSPISNSEWEENQEYCNNILDEDECLAASIDDCPNFPPGGECCFWREDNNKCRAFILRPPTPFPSVGRL